jgi:3D (Asp-Asp-Asp) domain-containing protein
MSTLYRSQVATVVAAAALFVAFCALMATGQNNDRIAQLEQRRSPTSSTSPAQTPRVTSTPASRSRRSLAGHRHPEGTLASNGTGTGSRLSTTAYCWTGNRTASGLWPQIGMAAGNRWPLGTRLNVEHVGTVVIRDRIGAGSDLDIYLGRDGCEQRARQFGRRHLRVEVTG